MASVKAGAFQAWPGVSTKASDPQWLSAARRAGVVSAVGPSEGMVVGLAGRGPF